VERFDQLFCRPRLERRRNRGGFGFLATGVQRDLSLPALRDLLPGSAYVAGGDGYFYLDSDKEWWLQANLPEAG